MPDGFVDQALGLRQLFEPRAARVLPVVGGAGSEPAKAALAMARQLTASGNRCLLIDASRGEVARRLGLAAKYELHHVQLGDRRLADVVLESGDMRVLPAARGLADFAQLHPERRLASLSRELGGREDWILVVAPDDLAIAASAFAAGGEVAVAGRLGASGRTETYALMKRISQATRTQRFRLIAGAGDAAHAECNELDDVARRFLGVRVAPGSTDPRTWSCAQLN